ncbi:MAG: helix-turn-helix transcriptional regulator [Saprospiraceae bacterium]|jgi:DNA-binding transcriptional ArsR family regulator|nr:helix-turn-helix transcriptional regulator [Saprospiraceae bacterium]
MKKTKIALNLEKLEYSTNLMRALAHPVRLKILEFIDRHKSINVNKIYSTLKLEQSITSQHLKIMKDVGLLECSKEGKYVHYSISYDKVEIANTAVKNYYNQEKTARV